MRVRVVICFVMVCLGLARAPAVAAEANADRIAQARTHFKEGSRFYDLAEYEAALHEFKEAYRAADDPAFLFNIAQCHRKLGHTREAITFYKTFVRRAPNSERRAEVERQIAQLERRDSDEAAKPRSDAPVEGGPVVVAPDLSARPPAPGAAAVEAPMVSHQGTAPLPAADTGRPFYRSGWFWIVTGAVVVGAVTTVVVLNARTQPSFCPDCVGTVGVNP